MTVVDPDLRERVLAWIDDDPDPATRAELQQVLDSADDAGPGAEAARSALAASPAASSSAPPASEVRSARDPTA